MARLTVFLLSLLVGALGVSDTERAPLLAANSPTRVEGQYIVVLNEDLTDDEVRAHKHTVRKLMDHYSGGNSTGFLGEYSIGDFKGYAAQMGDKVRDIVRGMSHVKYMEYDQVVHTMQDCTLQTDATWGIVRTTYVNKPTSDDYSYSANGEGVNVYIIDTGIYTGHPDFGGRAIWGVDYVDNPSPQTDLNGHGTHVAGTVMSDPWGLARKATAIAVRVLDQNGSGTTNGVINGINWVAGQHKSGKKSVANMSLGGSKSTSLNNAVDNAVDAGVNFAVAAGNEYSNACSSSPASASNCVTVAASDKDDDFAYFSNYGNCVDLIGPGVDITSTWLNGGINTISGTSMASPHVAGVMAKYLSVGTYTPAQLKTALSNDASKNKIYGVPSSTPNSLIFKDCA